MVKKEKYAQNVNNLSKPKQETVECRGLVHKHTASTFPADVLGEIMKYTKFDGSKTDDITEIRIHSDEYLDSFNDLLDQIVVDILENDNGFDELKYYMQKYYYAHENLESDLMPIDHLHYDYSEYDDNYYKIAKEKV